MASDHVLLDRKSQRDKIILPITLVANPEGERTLFPASTLDFSSDGLRIQTDVRLSIGEIIHVQFEKECTDLAYYEVVRTQIPGGLLPGQAGLRSLKSTRKTMAGFLAMSGNKPGRNPV